MEASFCTCSRTHQKIGATHVMRPILFLLIALGSSITPTRAMLSRADALKSKEPVCEIPFEQYMLETTVKEIYEKLSKLNQAELMALRHNVLRPDYTIPTEIANTLTNLGLIGDEFEIAIGHITVLATTINYKTKTISLHSHRLGRICSCTGHRSKRFLMPLLDLTYQN